MNGDGLVDLWGEVQGELRAFRGEAPEAWRALGNVHPPEEQFGPPLDPAHPAVDFDRDGIGDALIGEVAAPAFYSRQSTGTGSFTALARSGRDGRVIWKTALDPREGWFEPRSAASYNPRAFPLPEGDFDGDGTPDVVIQKRTWDSPRQKHKRAAALPLQLLSGRTGRLLWSAGPLPLGFQAQGYSECRWIVARSVEPGGTPDLLVWHGNPFAKVGSKFAVMRSPRTPSLARISGRDGRVLWDTPVSEIPEGAVGLHIPPSFGDLNGDGGLDAVFILPPDPFSGRPDHELLAYSLRDGSRLWSQAVKHHPNSDIKILVGDCDGDGRLEVIDVGEILEGNDFTLGATALGGRDGKLLWSWNSGPVMRSSDPSWTRSVLANLDGDQARRVALSYYEKDRKRKFVILAGNGSEIAHRELPGVTQKFLQTADLDGDGRDEFLINYGERIHAWRHDLTELWSWPDYHGMIDRILPASAGRPGEVIVYPAVGLAGSTGQPQWAGQAPLWDLAPSFSPKLLDRGNATRLPLLIADGLGATVCRVALPTDADGKIAAPRGALARPVIMRDDPRWTRPLPWQIWLTGMVGPWGFLAAGALALVNVVVPLVIIRLAAGRRRFGIRGLMALPIAAALPLMVFLMLEPVLPVGSSPMLGSEQRLFIGATAAGLPIVLALVVVIFNLARGRWWPLGILARAYHSESTRDRRRLDLV